MHIFDIQKFIENPAETNATVEASKINVSQGAPTTRWGHAATTYQGKLYILGGRNEQDVIDLHEFDPDQMKWKEIEFCDMKPKPRRRHSAVFVSGALIMFGGFDGSFYNDLHVIDF